MGVPHFYTWLISRYPLIKSTYNESTLPILDWFFMDLNGVIYRCVSDDTFAFKDMIKGRRFEEIFVHIINYVNEIIHLAQPQQLLFLAFDGVAPKAKMNQQRARRFKSEKKYQELDDALRSFGIIEKDEHFKNNSISPGTEFMYELSRHMKFFIQRKMMEDERWRKLEVIFSGVEIPGEGEHKILDFIRAKVQQPGFNPNTRVSIYGPDADLIMLALTTHLPFVCIFREQLKPRTRNTSACKRGSRRDDFDYLWINVLREYFEIEFSPLREKMGDRYNVEKIIDDFIFLCFFIGNDFLPRVFCMDIKIGNFDQLIEIFKTTLIESDGYINEKGVICWYRAVELFRRIAEFELKFIGDKLEEQENQQRNISRYQDIVKEIDSYNEEENKERLEEVQEMEAELKEQDDDNKYEALEKGDRKSPAKKEKSKHQDPNKFSTKDKLAKELLNEAKEEEAEEQDLINAGIANVEDAENFLLTYTNEEKISKLLSSRVLEKDIKFMSSLITIYRRNISEARQFYYDEKFYINAERNPHDLTLILTAYMQGLQFVLSYYYTGCPSWVWFYPYYYSPLISDLSNLMTHLNLPHVADNLIVFEQGKAYDPFKQLLLILPIGSNHLLPQSISKIVSDENTPLHKYYPKEFELDPFGAVFESEYIAKIPFVDEKLLDEEYNKGLKEAVLLPEEAVRNTVGNNISFVWDQKLPESEVQSTLPMYFESFKVRIKVTNFLIEDMPFNAKNILDALPAGSNNYDGSFPSLHYIKDKQAEMKTFTKRFVTFYKCCFKVHEPMETKEEKEYKKYLEQVYYCMYPFLTRCLVIGVITPEQLITNRPLHQLPFPYQKSDHKNYYKDISLNIHDLYFSSSGIMFEKTNPSFAIVSCESELRKDSRGDLYCPMPIIDIIPLDLLIPYTFEASFRGLNDPSQKRLDAEFPKFSDAIINVNPNCGSVAKVVGYSQSAEFDQVEVRVTSLVPNIANVTRNIAIQFDNQSDYIGLNTLAKQIGTEPSVLLTLLDSVVIKTETEGNEKSVYPERFDLGLNFIQRKYHTIVPELVICHELEQQNRKSRSFPQFKVAQEAADLLKEYYKLFKKLFDAIHEKIKSHDTSILTAGFVFPDSKNPNLELLRIYMWLVKQESANLALSNKASKVIPRNGITELEKALDKIDHDDISQVKKIVTKVFPYNPNYLIPKYTDNWIPPLFYKRPPWHKIGDRIVNLKINGRSFAPFGAAGTIVGILGNKRESDALEIKVEVMFDRPFVGGSNLGGRCKWGRGAIVDFDDVYNLNQWQGFIRARDRRQSHYYEGWDGYLRSYMPTFQTSDDPEESQNNSGGNQDDDKKAFSVLTRKLEGLAPTQSSGKQPTSNQPKIQANYQHQPTQPVPQFSQIQNQQKEEQNKIPANNQAQAQILEQLNQFKNLNNIGKSESNQQVDIIQKLSQQLGQTTLQSQTIEQNQFIQHLQQLQNQAPTSQPQAHTQIQSQNQGAQQPFVKPVFAPKSLGLKNPSTTTTATSQSSISKQNQTTSKVETQKIPPTQTIPTDGSQAGFNFNSFLNSNLSKASTSNPILGAPDTSTKNMSEASLKEALNLNLGGASANQSKKALNVSSKTFSVVQRPNPHDQVTKDPPAQTMNVSDLEKNNAVTLPTNQPQGADVLANLFANSANLNASLNPKENLANLPTVNVDEIEKDKQGKQIKEVSHLEQSSTE